jgi:hypothetical protein
VIGINKNLFKKNAARLLQLREWVLNKFDVTKVTEELIELYLDKLKDDTT